MGVPRYYASILMREAARWSELASVVNTAYNVLPSGPVVEAAVGLMFQRRHFIRQMPPELRRLVRALARRRIARKAFLRALRHLIWRGAWAGPAR